MNEADQKKMQEMLDKINRDNEKLKKEMGLGDSDGEDPEIANLAKQIHKIDAGKLDEEMDDDQLAALLDNMEEDDEDTAAAKVYCEQLTANINDAKTKAVTEKRAGNIPKAMEYMQKLKEYQAILDEQYLKYPKLKPKDQQPKVQAPQQQVSKPEPVKTKEIVAQKQTEPPQVEEDKSLGDDIDCEEKYHDCDKVMAMSVIENEMIIMQQLMKQAPKEDRDFYKDKYQSLEFAKSTLESNISIGVITPEKYIKNLKQYLAAQEKLLESLSAVNPKNKHYKRIANRIELVKNEIMDSEAPQTVEQPSSQDHPMAEPEPVQEPPQQSKDPQQERISTKNVPQDGAQQAVNQQQQQVSQQQQSRNQVFNEDQYLRQSTVHQSQLANIDDKEKQIFDTITERINDYRDATKYMMSVVGDKKRATEFLEIAEKLKQVQISISNGKKIDLLKLDPPVTPVLILGYNEEERQKKFNEIVKIYDQRFEEQKSNATKLIEASKKVTKKEQAEHLKQEAAKCIDAAKNEAQQKILLNEKRKNPWQAPPLTHMETVFVKKEKIFEDLKQNEIRVILKTHESLTQVGGTYLKVRFDMNEENALYHNFNDLSRDQTHVWTVDEQLFKTIDKKDLNVILKKKPLLWFASELETKKIKMNELSTKCEQTKEIVYKIKAQCSITFQIRQPLKGKEYEEVPTQKLVIDTFIEPFKSNQPHHCEKEEEKKQPAPQQQRKSVQQPDPKPVQVVEKPKPVAVPKPQPNPSAPVSIGDLPDGITIEDVNDPDRIENMVSMTYIEKSYNQIRAQAGSYGEKGQRIPPQVREKMNAIARLKGQITSQCQTGQISEQQYTQNLKDQIAKDKKLIQVFTKSGDEAKLAIVKERISMHENEIHQM